MCAIKIRSLRRCSCKVAFNLRVDQLSHVSKFNLKQSTVLFSQRNKTTRLPDLSLWPLETTLHLVANRTPGTRWPFRITHVHMRTHTHTFAKHVTASMNFLNRAEKCGSRQQPCAWQNCSATASFSSADNPSSRSAPNLKGHASRLLSSRQISYQTVPQFRVPLTTQSSRLPRAN